MQFTKAFDRHNFWNLLGVFVWNMHIPRRAFSLHLQRIFRRGVLVNSPRSRVRKFFFIFSLFSLLMELFKNYSWDVQSAFSENFRPVLNFIIWVLDWILGKEELMNQGYYDHQEKVCHEVLRSWHPEARRLLEIMALKSKFQKTSMMMRSRRPIILVVTSVTMTETGARPLVISRQCSRPGHRWRRSALQLSVTRKFSLPTGGFFLALAED